MTRDTLLQDLRFAVRQLRADPSFTVTALLALALGIGATAAIFSVVNGVLLRPLPYAHADRLVMMVEKSDRVQLPRMWVSLPNFEDWKERNRSFETLGAFGTAVVGLSGAGDPERIQLSWVTGELLNVLSARPAIGRSFNAEEQVVGGPRSVVLEHGLWQRRFASDPGVLGRVVQLDGQDYTVIGVMPPGFQFPQVFDGRVEAIISTAPVVEEEPDIRRRTNHPGLVALGRLRPGVTVEQARAEMQQLAAQLRQENPENFDDGVVVASLKDEVVGDARTALLVLLAAVFFLLLIACANVAGLQLARGAWRERELSLRSALGASRGRLIRQLLTESMLLSVIGGTLGLLVGTWGAAALLSISPGSLPRADQVEVDGRVLLFSLVVASLTGLLSGLAPAFLVSRTDLSDALKEGSGRTTAGLHRQRFRRLLVVSELALAVVLLAGAGLMIRSFQRLSNVHPGFDPSGVMMMELTLPTVRYPRPEQQSAFFSRVLERVGSLPGVKAAGVVTDPPLSGGGRQSGLRIADQAPPSGELPPLTDIEVVSPGYFHALGVPLIDGRRFSEQDGVTATRVAIVDEALAHRFWPGGNPIGKRVAFDNDEKGVALWREIIGVVRTVKNYGLDATGRMLIYVPSLQAPEATMTLVVRGGVAPAELVPAIRREIQPLDSSLPLGDPRVLERLLVDSVAPRRLQALLLSVFAATALLLASLGTYGVVAYSAARRSHEIGIRIALGAGRVQVLSMILRQGATLTLLGSAIGLLAALIVTRTLRSQLFEISPTDPLTFACITAVITLVTLVASYLPARRATRVDPLVALRSE
ncbi:MAG TPA: ABC transporter permease [Gemmatimonadales bacterium]|nr:ABC transporter permease [Gemmatimonadales bacterium]